MHHSYILSMKEEVSRLVHTFLFITDNDNGNDFVREKKIYFD